MVLNRVVHHWQNLTSKNVFKSSGAFLAKNNIEEFIIVSNFVLQNKIFNFSSSFTKNRVVQMVTSQNRVVQMHHWTRPNAGAGMYNQKSLDVNNLLT